MTETRRRILVAEAEVADLERALAGRRRMRARIDRVARALDHLSRILQMAGPDERASLLRRGIVDSTCVGLRVARVSLMLFDPESGDLFVVASRGTGLDPKESSRRKPSEGPSGLCFAEQRVLCVEDVEADPRFNASGRGRYVRKRFACVPLVCLGVPVGVLCLTEGEEEDGLRAEEAGLLRLMGMQISEFLAADPHVERLLQATAEAEAESLQPPVSEDPEDGDAELARRVCEAIARETEPHRVLEAALEAVSEGLGAESVALYLQSRAGARWRREAGVEAGGIADRVELPGGRGLLGGVLETGCLVATDAPEQEGRFDLEVDTPLDGGARPVLFVPIRIRERVIGVLRVFLARSGRSSASTAEVLSAAFSAAVRNVLLYRNLLQSIEEVASARRDARARTRIDSPS
jgi:GAF domain-containing protein